MPPSAPHPPLHLPPPPRTYWNIHPVGDTTTANAYEPDVQLGGAGLAADRGTPRSLPNARRGQYGDGDGDGGH